MDYEHRREPIWHRLEFLAGVMGVEALYLCIPKAQRTRYFSPSSRGLFLLNNVAFAACIAQIVRRMIGYEWINLDRVLFLIPIAGLTIHNVSMFVYIKCFAGARSEGLIRSSR